MDKKTKRVTWVYGEKTKMLNVRVPESKYDEILEKVYLILKDYQNPKSVDIELKSKVILGKGLMEQIREKPPIDMDYTEKDLDEAMKNVGSDVSDRVKKDLKKMMLPAPVKAKEYKYVSSSPIGCDTVEVYGKGRYLLSYGGIFYTKHSEYGTLVVIEHDSEQSALDYCLTNYRK